MGMLFPGLQSQPSSLDASLGGFIDGINYVVLNITNHFFLVQLETTIMMIRETNLLMKMTLYRRRLVSDSNA